MLVRSLKLPASPTAAAFADQPDIPDWASVEVAVAVKAGILQGYED